MRWSIVGFVVAIFCIFSSLHSSAQVYPTRFRKLSRLTEPNIQPPITTGANFGIKASAIGDLDDDGVEDLGVGATNYDGTWIGAAYILFMNSNGTVKSSTIIKCPEPPSEKDSYGSSIVKLGDLDDDGVEDIAIGAGYDSDGDYQEGAIWIVFMKKDGTVKAQQKISSLAGGFNAPLSQRYVFGTGASAVGDIDGDGNNEIVVGARYSGVAYILYLNNNGTVKRYTTISSADGLPIDTDEGLFGYEVAGIGDVNLDGVPDVAIGGHRSDQTSEDSGVVFVVFLKANGTVKGFQTIAPGGPGPGGFNDASARLLGLGLVGIGDYDGDDIPDMVISGTDESTSIGAIWYLMLKSDGTIKSMHKISSRTTNPDLELHANDLFGGSIAYLGDINSDGIPDLAIAAFLDDDGGTNSGALWLTVPPCGTNAGSDVNVCSLKTVTLNASSPVAGEQGTWSIVAGSATFTDIHDPKAQVSQLAVGTNEFKWTISGGSCGTLSDNVKIVTESAVKPNAGQDIVRCDNPASINLSGNVPFNTTATWTQILGSGTIANGSNPTTTVSNLSAGDNKFVLTFNSNAYCIMMKDTVMISISSNIKISAGEDQRICDRSAGVTLFGDEIVGTSSEWTLYSGSGTIVNKTAARTVVTDLSLGKNIFIWTVRDAPACPTASDTVNVFVDKTVEPNAGEDQFVCDGTLAVLLEGNSTENRLGEWSIIAGGATLTDRQNATTIVKNPTKGLNRFVWSFLESNYCPLLTDTVEVILFTPPVAKLEMKDTTYTCEKVFPLKATKSSVNGEWSVTHGSAQIGNVNQNEATITLPEINKPVEITWTLKTPGCPTSEAKAVVVPLNFSAESIPNVITPNGDGKNDLWRIDNIQHTSNSLRLYNRWGEEVLNTSDYKNDWSGKNVSPGVYYFFINIAGCTGELKGWLSVVN